MPPNPHPGPNFALKVSDAGDATVVHLAGEVDVSTAPQLRTALMDVVDTRRGPVILDCRCLRFMDSSGLGVLVVARHRLQAEDRSLTLRSVRPHLSKVLRIMALDRLFDFEP